MKIAKVLGILLLIYVGIVVIFESLLGYFQPSGAGTLVITTTDGGGSKSDRVLAQLDSGGNLYVGVNHWPRDWYRDALENPAVEATVNGEKGDFVAVEINGAEYDRVNQEHALPFVFRVLTGFPPRYIMRLDPR
jgi:hypothetical protein